MATQPVIVTFPTSDRTCPTRGYLFEAPKQTSSPIVILAIATGVPGRFYGPFASWLSSEHALTTLVVDYRYNGISFPDGVDIRNPTARTAALKAAKDVTIAKQWVEDLRSAFRFMRQRYPGRSVSYVGHSVGAHIAPLVQSPGDNVVRNLFVGNVLLYYGYFPDADERLQKFIEFEKVVADCGYYPSTRLGLGEDTTAGIGLNSQHWMSLPRYVATDHPAEYDYYKGRILSIAFTDDKNTHPLPACFTVDRFLHTMPQAITTRIIIDPKALGWKPAGHVDVFRPIHQADAWPAMAQWIKYGEISPALRGDRWDSSGLTHELHAEKQAMARL